MYEIDIRVDAVKEIIINENYIALLHTSVYVFIKHQIVVIRQFLK